jgi:hypothetical protein
MSKPLVVTIPHSLGKAEASRRLKSGIARIRTTFASKLAVLDESWSGDRLDFRVGLFGQETNGTIDVGENEVRLEVMLPWVLAALAEKAKALVHKHGQLMLEKK